MKMGSEMGSLLKMLMSDFGDEFSGISKIIGGRKFEVLPPRSLSLLNLRGWGYLAT